MSSKIDAPTPRPAGARRWLWPALFFVVGALITAGVFALLMNIAQRKQEATQPNFQVVQLTDTSFDPAEWGKNFPAQYEGWKNTSINESETSLRTPAPTDPAAPKDVAPSKLTADPRLVTMWQGYAFAVEYNEPRGHAYMLSDQQLVKRVQPPFKQPGACLNCHTSLPEVLNKIGGDPAAAWATMNKMPYTDATKLASHPVSCIDCHEPTTMKLRVSRPAFIAGIKEYKAGQGIANFDVNTMATNNEMRAYVCAQCHVEYYFKGDAKTLTFPWDKGLTVNNALDYYDEIGFSDWTNTLTNGKMLKAQHPDFETWSQGIHAANGVTCADCHMPYKREGAVKVSDHQIGSPLKSEAQINSTCLTCHHETEAEMKERVETIQGRWKSAQNISFDALDQLIRDIVAAKQANVNPEWIAAAQQWQRKASYFQDYTVSENSKGFHAPQYSLTIINEVTDAARRGQAALKGITLPVTTDATKYTPMIATPAPSTAPATTPAATPGATVAPSSAAPAAPTPLKPVYSQVPSAAPSS